MISKYLLEMEDISKSFSGVRALDRVSLRVRPGTVHALMGENGAGKSTLMKCLFGIYRMDSGVIRLDGGEVDFPNPHAALVNGISMVHQELEQVQGQSVADNVWLGRFPTRAGMVDDAKMRRDTSELLQALGLSINPATRLSRLTVSQRQMVDIAKAVSYDCKILVLDEPTSSLTDKEVAHLFEIIGKLKRRGIGIVYISHKMEEIYAVADEVTILRDGKYVDTRPVTDVTMEDIIVMMVGRSLENRFPPKENMPGEELLRVENLDDEKGFIRDVSLTLRKGEILGLAGLLGAGRTELLELIFGLRRRGAGGMFLHGRAISNRNSTEAIANRFGLCTEERRHNGIFPGLSVRFNAVMANVLSYRTRLRWLDSRRMTADTQWVIDNFKVKTPGQDIPIRLLSGGNQQKVLLGRWMMRDPEVLLMDDPTRGIDVGAKYDIYSLIMESARKGKGVIIASSEMPELLGLCDRIAVMSNGRLADVYDLRERPEEATQANIFRSTIKYI